MSEQEIERPLDIDAIVSGAIFDFAGFLTTLDETVEIGMREDASLMVELVRKWSDRRGLPIDNAEVEHWRELYTHVPMP